MQGFVIFLGVLALLLIWWNLWVSRLIVLYLRDKGESASLFKFGFFIKGKIFSYLPLYRKRSLEDEGKVGKLYWQFYFSFATAMFLIIIGVIMLGSK